MRYSRMAVFAVLLMTVATAAAQSGGKEYKLLLVTEPFQDREEGIKDFWHEVGKIAANVKRASRCGDLFETKERWVEYFDTRSSALRRNGLTFRQRTKLKDGEPDEKKLTLKFRSDSREQAASAKIEPIEGKDKDHECKLEEDIVDIDSSKFSHSASTELEQATFKKVSDIAGLFKTWKDLPSHDQPIRPVNGFRAFEAKVEGAKFIFGKDDAVHAEASLTFWYQCSSQGKLLLAEFSYTISDGENCPVDPSMEVPSAEEADKLYQELRTHLGGWINPNSGTKTEIAYSGSSCTEAPGSAK